MPTDPPDERESDAWRADVGLVCALAMELDPFFDECDRVRAVKGDGMRFRGGRLAEIRVAAVETGPGLERAQRGTEALIAGHRPAAIVAVGFAGGLVDPLRAGELVVPDSVVFAGKSGPEEIRIAHSMAPDPGRGLHVGRLASAEAVLRTITEKRELAESHGAIACDMESHAVAKCCQAARIPCMIVRSLTDDSQADLPREVHVLLSGSGARRIGAAMGAAWNRPESMKDMWALRTAAARAARRMAPFLSGVIEQMHESTRRAEK